MGTFEEAWTSTDSAAFEIPFDKKPIQCTLDGKRNEPLLVITHGSGGTHKAAAMQHLNEGASASLAVLSWTGNMNLKSRTKMLKHVCDSVGKQVILGGRSMGARAAVQAFPEVASAQPLLVLHSYPLTDAKGNSRQDILLALAGTCEVLFVVGTKDTMCSIDDLAKVRQQMAAKTWCIVVTGANHGLVVRNADITKEIGLFVGKLVGDWCKNRPSETEGTVSWNETEPDWSGWGETATETAPKSPVKRKSQSPENSSDTQDKPRKRTRRS